MPESPRQANVQGTGIITGDINLSFSAIKENQEKNCYLCKSLVDYQSIGGRLVHIKDGRKFMFCDWCYMCLKDLQEKVKKYQ